MPSIKENLRVWNEKYDWSDGGDEWSSPWGGVDAQWRFVILPRISRFVPCGRILEIGSGFGRWSEYLRALCDELVLTDVSDRCITACRKRFGDVDDVRFHVTDGKSLAMVEDATIDFVFSFDSLVHVELDVMEAYVGQLADKLTPQGAAFLHHSNLAAIDELGGEHTHWRGQSVSAGLVRECAERVGLLCCSQELVNFGDSHVGRGSKLIDCFTVLCRPDAMVARPTSVLENPDFMEHSVSISRLASLYAVPGEPTGSSPETSRWRRLLRRAPTT
jgi:SAM-dependent methyltransferase